MWRRKEREPIGLFLTWIVIIWIFSFVALKLLQPYSVAYSNTEELTLGYLAYALIGMVFTTPAPFLAMMIVSFSKEGINFKEFFKRIIYIGSPLKTVILTGVLCGLALIYALINGESNGTPGYMIPISMIVTIPFVGIAEETGWRGFLQPALEKKIRFPFSVILVSAIWFIWHIDQWLDPTSNHYGDSLVGFAITIFVWSFALAALFKATKSVLACAVYHAFIDSIGVSYDWNKLFDAFPGNLTANVYRIILLLASICIWIYADKKETTDEIT